MVDSPAPSNIPIPDPSLATAAGLKELESKVRGWIDSLQLLEERERIAAGKLFEEKIKSAEAQTGNLDRVVQTRLAGSETALNAAMAASDKVVQEIKLNFGAVINEMRVGITKQIENLDRTINDLKERVTESGGQSKGTNQMIAWLIAGLSAVAALASFIMIAVSRSAP